MLINEYSDSHVVANHFVRRYSSVIFQTSSRNAGGRQGRGGASNAGDVFDVVALFVKKLKLLNKGTRVINDVPYVLWWNRDLAFICETDPRTNNGIAGDCMFVASSKKMLCTAHTALSTVTVNVANSKGTVNPHAVCLDYNKKPSKKVAQEIERVRDTIVIPDAISGTTTHSNEEISVDALHVWLLLMNGQGSITIN